MKETKKELTKIYEKLNRALNTDETDAEESFELLYEVEDNLGDLIESLSK